MSSGVRNLFQKNFMKFRYFSFFVLLFAASLFVIVVLQNDFMRIKEDSYEDFILPRLMFYKFFCFNTGFLKLFVKFFSSACI